MGEADQQHLDWLARSTGRADYRPLDKSDSEALQRVGELVELSPGSQLFRESKPATETYLVVEGEVEISRGAGPRRRVVAYAGPGSVLGDLAMFRGTAHIANARALRAVKAYRFDRSRLLPELALHPEILLRWLVAAMRRLEETQRRIVGLMHKTVLAQVADILAEEAARQPNVNLSQSTIARLLGVSRQSVNESLARLRHQGVVETGYRRIKILDPDRLTEIAES